MKADRENNRLPLRAGAMILFAIAVVFIYLGWHSAATSGKDPEADLVKAGQSAQASQPSKATSSDPSSSEAPASSSTEQADGETPKLCVLNAGKVTGLAKEVADSLQGSGFSLGTEPSNLSTSSISENTIFYDEGGEDAAKKVADAVPGGASTEARPSSFTKCPGELVVIVVNR